MYVYTYVYVYNLSVELTFRDVYPVSLPATEQNGKNKKQSQMPALIFTLHIRFISELTFENFWDSVVAAGISAE